MFLCVYTLLKNYILICSDKIVYFFNIKFGDWKQFSKGM